MNGENSVLKIWNFGPLDNSSMCLYHCWWLSLVQKDFTQGTWEMFIFWLPLILATLEAQTTAEVGKSSSNSWMGFVEGLQCLGLNPSPSDFSFNFQNHTCTLHSWGVFRLDTFSSLKVNQFVPFNNSEQIFSLSTPKRTIVWDQEPHTDPPFEMVSFVSNQTELKFAEFLQSE